MEKVAALAWIRRPDSRGIDGQNQWNRQKMPPKRYERSREYHTYTRLRDYQTVRSPYPPSPHPDDAWCQWEFILFPFFSLDSSNIEN